MGRFLQDLQAMGKALRYQELLHDNFNAQTLEGLM